LNTDNSNIAHLPLGRVFGVLTRQYIGILARRMKNTPVEKNYFALFLIGKNSGKISQQQLADQLLTDKVSMVRMLDCLEDSGLIERTVNPGDRRQHLLVVTPKAEPWLEEIGRALHETDEVFLSFIAPEYREAFRLQLQQLCMAVIDLPAEEVELFYNRIKDLNHDQNN
jgi:MarR family transcriptional regulator for hemolysin